MRFELPKVEDLRLTTLKFDFECSYLVSNSSGPNTYYIKHLKYCMKIVPYA